MSMYQLSYGLLWTLAIALMPVCFALYRLMKKLKFQVLLQTARGVNGRALLGQSLANLLCREVPSGQGRLLSHYLKEKNILLVISPHCNTCNVMLEDIRSYTPEKRGELNFITLCMARFNSCHEKDREAPSSDVAAIPFLSVSKDMMQRDDNDLWDVGFPAILFLDNSGVIVDVRHPVSIRALMTSLKRERFEPPVFELAAE